MNKKTYLLLAIAFTLLPTTLLKAGIDEEADRYIREHSFKSLIEASLTLKQKNRCNYVMKVLKRNESFNQIYDDQGKKVINQIIKNLTETGEIRRFSQRFHDEMEKEFLGFDFFSYPKKIYSYKSFISFASPGMEMMKIKANTDMGYPLIYRKHFYKESEFVIKTFKEGKTDDEYALTKYEANPFEILSDDNPVILLKDMMRHLEKLDLKNGLSGILEQGYDYKFTNKDSRKINISFKWNSTKELQKPHVNHNNLYLVISNVQTFPIKTDKIDYFLFSYNGESLIMIYKGKDHESHLHFYSLFPESVIKTGFNPFRGAYRLKPNGENEQICMLEVWEVEDISLM